jgi:hypothetical protein
MISSLLSLERLVCGQNIKDQISSAIKCFNCQKISFSNGRYNGNCHAGIYCLDCISYCQICCHTQGEPISQLTTLMKNVSIKCQYCIYGCAGCYSIDQIQEHEKKCPYKENSNAFPQFPLVIVFIGFTLTSLIPVVLILTLLRRPHLNFLTICWLLVLVNLAIKSLAQRVDALESQKAGLDFKFVIQKKELCNQISDFQALMESTYKQFVESNALS